MTRFNYLRAPARKPVFVLSGTFAIDNRIRGPLAALVATFILTGALSLVQFSRFTAAQRAYVAQSQRLLARAAQVEAVTALRATTVRKSRLIAHVDAVRRMSLAHANELAWIGNHLPADTWLGVLRYEHGSYSLEGASERAAAVGSAMLALRDNPRSTLPKLVSLRDDADTSGAARIRYTLRLETP